MQELLGKEVIADLIKGTELSIGSFDQPTDDKERISSCTPFKKGFEGIKLSICLNGQNAILYIDSGASINLRYENWMKLERHGFGEYLTKKPKPVYSSILRSFDKSALLVPDITPNQGLVYDHRDWRSKSKPKLVTDYFEFFPQEEKRLESELTTLMDGLTTQKLDLGVDSYFFTIPNLTNSNEKQKSELLIGDTGIGIRSGYPVKYQSEGSQVWDMFDFMVS